MATKKRERLEVIHDILFSVRNNGSRIKPTRLLHQSNLSPQMFKEYLDELTSKDFLKETELDGKKEYALTKKGFEYLEKYAMLKAFIENLGL